MCSRRVQPAFKNECATCGQRMRVQPVFKNEGGATCIQE